MMLTRLREIPELQLSVLGGLLNGGWEFAHSSLYTDHVRGLWYIVWTRLHCTVGDVMILLACFWITSLLFRSRHWPRSRNPGAVVLFWAMGLGYTIFSEWYNTTVSKSWEYVPAMPTAFGIGLTPMLQWIIVPPVLVWVMHALVRDTHHPLQRT